MAVAEKDQKKQETDGENGDEQQQESSSGGARNAALKAAAAAAATTVATYAVKKALTSGDGGGSGSARSSNGNGSGSKEGKQKQGGATGSIITSAASSAWDSASDLILPVAEDAAGAAGKYLAQSGPDVVRERIVPRFIKSFNEAS